ncbi:MAG: hypothetical protein ACHQ52_02900 [Candidatus Eisenbacteria bacterium]
MKTRIAMTAALLLALAATGLGSAASAATSVSIGVQLGNAPPPPVVVYRHSPDWVYVPGPQVYVVNDNRVGYDYFRYGGMFYIYNDGWWYRARSYRGPFVAVETRYVPRPIFAMNDRQYHWRHRPEVVAERDDVPPGWHHGKAAWKDRGDDDNHDHGHGHDRH